MSGIVGIMHLDQAPIDSDWLTSTTKSMAFAGPDAQETWSNGQVGFGHAMLRTTFESEREQQPRSLDGRVWITADARIDARTELKDKLESNGCQDLHNATDVDLILYTYHVWGKKCVQHLLGDFAFAIWDAQKQRLFCARDHFGIRPFFYAHVDQRFIFSNLFNCVREHPAVSDEINDLAIANFLLFRRNPKLDITSLADIRRLPPAHCLSYEGGDLRIERYWTLPIADAPVRYKSLNDYVERFRELFDAAVNDRLRTGNIAVFMSGGMDSTSIAATACHLLASQAKNQNVKAYTFVYDRLILDQERYWSGLVATHLRIPIHYFPLDDVKSFEGWDGSLFKLSELADFSRWRVDDESFQKIVEDGKRVAFSGVGSDPLFCDHNDLLRSARYLGFRYLGGYVLESLYQCQLPRFGIRSPINNWKNKIRGWSPYDESYHDENTLKKLKKDLIDRLGLPRSWWQSDERSRVHPWRPAAYRQLTDPIWPIHFELLNHTQNRWPIEFRFPFFDRRVVEYVLTIPPLLQRKVKTILRESMKGRLPEAVRTRPKSPLAGNPVHGLAPWVLQERNHHPLLTRYFNSDSCHNNLQLRKHACQQKEKTLICLNYWLKESVPLKANERYRQDERQIVKTEESLSPTRFSYLRKY